MRNTITKRIIIVAMIVCLIVVACALASCSIKKKALDSVNAESIKYDGQTITWDGVKKAASYSVQVNDDNYTATDTKLDVEVTTDVTISILAKADENSKFYRDAESSATATFTAVGPVEVSFDGSEFVWTEAEGYTEYLCEQSGIETLLRVTGTALAPARSADSANSDSKASLRVKPYVTDAHSFAVWSNTKSVTILRAPTNIAYNAYNADDAGIVLNNLITWDPVPGATKYRVELEGKTGEENIVTEVKASEFVFSPIGVIGWDEYVYGNDDARKSFWVKITAIGDPSKDIMDSQTKEKNFLHVAALDISLLTTDHGALSWANYEGGADKFDVYLRYTQGGVEKQEVYSTYKPTFDGLDANINYHVRILPTSDDKNVYSEWSVESDFQFLAAPSISMSAPDKDDVKKSSVIVNDVALNTNYNVNIYKNAPRGERDSETVGDSYRVNATDGTMQLFWPVSEPGEYYVYCTAEDASGVIRPSRYSDPIRVIVLEQITAVTFGTKDLDSPKFENNKEVRGSEVLAAFNTPEYADSVDILLDGTTPVTSTDSSKKIYYSVENGVAYRVHFTMELLDGDLVNGTYSSVQLRSTYKNAGKTEVRDGYDTVIFNSELATGFALNQLEKVGNVDCTSDVITWNPVGDAIGYYYSILDDKDGSVQASGFVYGTSVPVPSTLPSGTHKFYVAPKGNGNIKVTGSFSTPYYLYKLPKPTGLKVVENSMTLSWNGDVAPKKLNDSFTTQAAQYAITIGNAMDRVDLNTFTLESVELLHETGTLVTVRAVAAQTEDLHGAATVSSDYSDHIIIYKLATPQVPSVTDSNFHWNKVENAASYSLCYGTDTVNRSVLCRLNVSQSDNVTPHVDIITDPQAENAVNGEVLLSRLKEISAGESIRFYLVAHADAGTADDRSPFTKKTENGVDKYYFESDAGEAATIAVLKTPVPTTNEASGEMEWDAVQNAQNYCVIVKRIPKGSNTPTTVDTYTMRAELTGNSFTPLIFGADGDKIKMELYALGDNGLTAIRSTSVFWDITLKDHKVPVATDFTVAFEKGGSGKNTNILVVTMKESAAEASEAQIYGINIGGIENTYSVAELTAGAKIALTSGGDYKVCIRAIGGDMVKTESVYDPTSRYLDSEMILLESVSVIRDFTTYDAHMVRIDGALTIEVAEIPNATHVKYSVTYKNSNKEELGTYTLTDQSVAYSNGFAYITMSADAIAAGAVTVDVTLNGYRDPASDTIVDAQRPQGYSFGLK